MAGNFELLKNMSAIYRCAFFHQSIHKNTMKNQLIFRKKITSKNKFYQAFDRLVETGGIIKDKDMMVSINPNVVKTGVLYQENEDEFYVVFPDKSKYRISKSVASSYKDGDPLHVVLQDIGGQVEAIVLGKNYDGTFVAYQEKKIKQEEERLEKGNLALGRVVKISHDQLVFIPNRKNLPIRQIPILNEKEELSAFQDKICIMKFANNGDLTEGGYIVEVKGDAGNPIHEYDAIAESYGAIMSWEGDKLEREIAKIPTSVSVDSLSLITEPEAKNNQRGNVVDLRNLPFATVDPATCKDMDDAIYSTFNANGDIVCYIAVANVTKYVDLNTEIGRKYIEGGFTVYAPNKAYNILPTKLSTGICSLNPNEDRLAFVVKATIDKRTGKVKKSRIFDALISSRRKYSYEEAQEIVDQTADEVTRGYLMAKYLNHEELTEEEQVVMNYYAAQTIKHGFDERGMIRFVASKEREIQFDEDLQNIVDIKLLPHLYYHEVIEAFMISANEATAKYAQDHNLDNVYRVHEEPNPHKMARAAEFFSILGVEFDGDLSAEGTRELIELVTGTANEEAVNNFLIKMQSRAVYSNHPYSEEDDDDYMEGEEGRISHYALQSPHYSHTTSPIRRVPDYITQYNILAHMHGTAPLSLGKISKIIDIANSRQIDVDQAERDFEEVNSAMYCESHIGEKMHGRITKIRYTTADEGYEDDIIVIVKEQNSGVHAEIPLSQIIGKPAKNCFLSKEGCAVYDEKGNVLVTICTPIDFYIAAADRKSMKVVGCTHRQQVKSHTKPVYTDVRPGDADMYNTRQKTHTARRRADKKKHNHYWDDEDGKF